MLLHNGPIEQFEGAKIGQNVGYWIKLTEIVIYTMIM